MQKEFFFTLNCTTPQVITGFEQLSSSIWCWVMAGQILSEKANCAFSEKFWNRQKSGFLTHNVGYRYASKSIQSSVEADFCLLDADLCQQNIESKEWVNGLGRTACQRWPKFPKHVFVVTSPPKKGPPETKNVFFRFQVKDLLNP